MTGWSERDGYITDELAWLFVDSSDHSHAACFQEQTAGACPEPAVGNCRLQAADTGGYDFVRQGEDSPPAGAVTAVSVQ